MTTPTTILELRERLRETEKRAADASGLLKAGRHAFDDLNPHGKTLIDFYSIWLDQAEARATTAERALVERDAQVAAYKAFLDDFISQFVCWGMMAQDEENEAVKHFVARAEAFPTSARLAADVLEAADEETDAEDMVDADTTLLKIKTRDALGLIKEKRRAAVAAWRAGRT